MDFLGYVSVVVMWFWNLLFLLPNLLFPGNGIATTIFLLGEIYLIFYIVKRLRKKSKKKKQSQTSLKQESSTPISEDESYWDTRYISVEEQIPFVGKVPQNTEELEEWFRQDLNYIQAGGYIDEKEKTRAYYIHASLGDLSPKVRNFLKLYIYLHLKGVGIFDDKELFITSIAEYLIKSGVEPSLRSIEGRISAYRYAEVLEEVMKREKASNSFAQIEVLFFDALKHIVDLYQKGELKAEYHYVIECLSGGGGWLSEGEQQSLGINALQQSVSQDKEERGLENRHVGDLIVGITEKSSIPAYAQNSGNSISPHLVTIAPSGSGKGQCHVIPNLRMYEGGTFTIDVKGDNYQETYRERLRENNKRVFRFDVDSDGNCDHYNPLDAIRTDDLADLEEDCIALSELMIVPTGDKSDHWESSSRELVKAILMFLKFKQRETGESATVNDLCRIVWNEDNSKFVYQEMIENQWGHWDQLEDLGSGFISLMENSPKEYASVKSSVKTSLSPWQREKVKRVTAQTAEGWDIWSLKTNPASIFVTVPPARMSQYASILRVLVGQHIQALIHDHSEKPQVPFLFILDEFPLLKRMDIIKDVLNVGRSYGIKLWLFVQSISQLKEAWPQPDVLLNACGHKMFMGVNDSETEKYILGLVEQGSENYLGEQKETIKQGELMGPKWEGKILWLRQQTKPMKLNKRLDYQVKGENTSELKDILRAVISSAKEAGGRYKGHIVTQYDISQDTHDLVLDSGYDRGNKMYEKFKRESGEEVAKQMVGTPKIDYFVQGALRGTLWGQFVEALLKMNLKPEIFYWKYEKQWSFKVDECRSDEVLVTDNWILFKSEIEPDFQARLENEYGMVFTPEMINKIQEGVRVRQYIEQKRSEEELET